MGFEMVRSQVAAGRVAPFGVVIGEVIADFQPGFAQIAEAAIVQ